MKKLGICIIFLIIAVIIAILFPWGNLDDIKDRLFGVKNNYASLKVYSLAGNMKLYIDEEEKGLVKRDEQFLEIFPISLGEHNIKLIREASNDEFYLNFEKIIKFEKGFDTVLSWEIGPTEDSSSGWILYAQNNNTDANNALLNLECRPDDCKVDIDSKEEYLGSIKDMTLGLETQHYFKVSKDGYQDLEFHILPEDENSRKSLKGYTLYIEVYLYKIPL
jgi:hypothetical protein